MFIILIIGTYQKYNLTKKYKKDSYFNSKEITSFDQKKHKVIEKELPARVKATSLILQGTLVVHFIQ